MGMKTLHAFILMVASTLSVMAAEVRQAAIPVNLQVGQKATILLEGNPTTGFIWQQEKDLPAESAARVDLTCTAQLGDTSRCGFPTPTTLSITGVKPGKATVHVVYRRPWEKGKDPAAERTFTVTVAPTEK